MPARRRGTGDRQAPAHLQRRHWPLELVRDQTASLTFDTGRRRRDLYDILRAGIAAADAGSLLRTALQRTSSRHFPGHTYLISAGKAAWPMSRAFLDETSGVAAGLIAGPRIGHVDAPPAVTCFDGAHPSPDASSESAGRRALALAAHAARDGHLVVLLSGGSSAMIAAPAAGVTLADKAVTARALMDAGVAIAPLNCVRKHLSAIKGGMLGAAANFRTRTFALSDVHTPVEDDPAVIGSGPTVPDPTTFTDALAVVRNVKGDVPSRVLARLEAGARGEIPETLKPGTPGFESSTYEVIGNRHSAMQGAAVAARAMGYEAVVVGPPTRGEARDAGAAFAREACRLAEGRAGRVCVIASGETTVTVAGAGLGGRNHEFALGALEWITSAALDSAVLCSAGTDGIDGPTDSAGAFVDATTPTRARALGLDPAASLARNDSYTFFNMLGDTIVLGPTGTNVGDLHLIVFSRSSQQAVGGKIGA